MNAIEYIRNLEAVGISREQAEVHARGLTDIMEEKFATKQDLYGVRDNLRGEIQRVKGDLKAEIQLVRSELKAEIQQVRNELTADILLVRSELKADILQVRSELKADVLQLRTEMNSEFKLVRSEIRELESRLTHNLTIRLGSIMTGGLAFFSVFITLLEHFLK